MVRKRLHHYLKRNLIDVLRADTFVHVDTADTRAWGNTHVASSDEYEEVLKVLQPVAAKSISYTSPKVDSNVCAASISSTGGAESKVCHAHDCGTFGCGCYLPSCTHCVTTTYTPQHLHTSECLQMINANELKRNKKYDLIIKIRPDMNVTKPMPSSQQFANILLPNQQPFPPYLCTQAAPRGEPERLTDLPLTMDDKFAMMPRAVASVYMNATSAFAACQSRATNLIDCGDKGMGGKGAAVKAMKGGLGMKGGKGMSKGGMYKVGGLKARLPPDVMLQRSKEKARLKGRRLLEEVIEEGRRLQMRHQPYWATPQCVLKRHLLAGLGPELRMINCMAALNGPLLRLVRP